MVVAATAWCGAFLSSASPFSQSLVCWLAQRVSCDLAAEGVRVLRSRRNAGFGYREQRQLLKERTGLRKNFWFLFVLRGCFVTKAAAGRIVEQMISLNPKLFGDG